MSTVPVLLLWLLVAGAASQALGSPSRLAPAHTQTARRLLHTTAAALAQHQPAGRALLNQQQQHKQDGGGGSCALLSAVKAAPSLRLFASLIGRCSLEGSLCEAAKAGTLLAPSDQAVSAYLTRRKISLGVLTANKSVVKNMLLFHIIPDDSIAKKLTALPEGQTTTLHTAASTAPSEVVARRAGGSLAFTDARGRTGKVVQTLNPSGPSGPCLFIVDRVLAHTPNTLGLIGVNGMAGVKSVEESGSPRMNAKASIAHASGAVGISRNGAPLMQQDQP